MSLIKVVNGDVTKATEDIIVHQVNCQGKMASGVAKAIRTRFPVAYDEYMKAYDNAVDKRGDAGHLLGYAQVVQVEEDKFVCNLFGQEFYGYDGHRYTSYDALYDGLTSVKKHAEIAGKSVAIPYKVGSDRGGADWSIVRKMIYKIFEGYEVTLYKYEEAK